MGREGFEPPKAKPADLQSAPFDRSGTCPLQCRDYKVTHCFETDKGKKEKKLPRFVEIEQEFNFIVKNMRLILNNFPIFEVHFEKLTIIKVYFQD